MRIVVVEDNELYRDELLQCLEQEESDIEIIGSAANGARGLALVEKLVREKAGPGKSWSGRDIYRHPNAGDGWIRDDRSPSEKKDILQNCDYKFLSRISVCKTCNGAWCR